MNNTYVDTGFIHDLSQLDKLRQGGQANDKNALKAAASQFESVFTQMLFKSMRESNAAFKSDLMSSSTLDFYEQMRDEQMSSELANTNSLGLADLIVQQLGGQTDTESVLNNSAQISRSPLPATHQHFSTLAKDSIQVKRDSADKENGRIPPVGLQTVLARTDKQKTPDFQSPEKFVETVKPYAQKAAKSLGVKPSALIAQAALETGWGKKVIGNATGSSFNLFNIKAAPDWNGNKMATQTLEVYDGIPVQQKAAFRSYASLQESFDDYVDFIKSNPRYSEALAQADDSKRYIEEIHKAGYATDPQYSDKVVRVMNQVEKMM